MQSNNIIISEGQQDKFEKQRSRFIVDKQKRCCTKLENFVQHP